MRFFLDINPPTATAQEKSVRIVGGRPIFYDPAPNRTPGETPSDSADGGSLGASHHMAFPGGQVP